jgi:MEDS: MEthanogen/methylotroph, DcmR Sensory domain
VMNDDVAFRPGDHVCALYRGSKGRDEVLVSYLREGIHQGQRCICYLDGAEGEPVADDLRARLRRAEPGTPEQWPEIVDFTRSYLREGRFSETEWLDVVRTPDDLAGGTQGTPVVRAAGEMTWSLRTGCPGVEAWSSYEARINLRPSVAHIFLCLYDIERFRGDAIIDVLRTHPKVVTDNGLIDNPYYVPPERFLAEAHLRS